MKKGALSGCCQTPLEDRGQFDGCPKCNVNLESDSPLIVFFCLFTCIALVLWGVVLGAWSI